MSKPVEYVSVTLLLRILDAKKLRAEVRGRAGGGLGHPTLAEMAQIIVDDSVRLELDEAGLSIEESRCEAMP